MDQRVTFAGDAPSWTAVRGLLATRGLDVQFRMIDGELAYPDEEPPANWREVRVAAAQGMMTVRREGGGVVLVIWGNADAGLRQVWNGLAWAFAAAGGGRVETAGGFMTADEYANRAELPAAFQP
jgi:hypothetical protein